MVSHTAKRLLLLALPIATLIHAPGSVRADDDDDEMPPPPPPGAVQVYPAPLSQTTQTTYVPQSVALSGPEEITDADPTRPVPLGYTAVERPRKGLIIGGAVTLGVSYGISAFAASIGEDVSDGENEVAALFIPVAGPFLQLGHTESATAKFFLVGLGTAQIAGAVMLYYGLTTTKRVFVRNDLVGSMTVTPMTGDGTTGMVLSGRF